MEIIGYTLCRTAIYEKAVMLNGNGDNGKGVFIKLIEAFVGRENCSHVPLQELDNDKFSSADLFGKLVNTFADLNLRSYWQQVILRLLCQEILSEPGKIWKAIQL